MLGVLSVQSFKKNAYTEQNLSLLENLAAYTTIALDNANAYQVINQREHEVSERAAELSHHQPHQPGARHPARQGSADPVHR